MANRKVLINRHTSGNTAPVAADMYKGEIAVQHKSGEEILWTKNNDDVMVPFISCAQTITMINNAISDADVTYDVKAANGDAHVEVASGGTEKAKVFTVSSKDVQSKAAFDAYSAATDATIKNNYNTLSGAIDDVLEMLITAVTGEGVIEVKPETTGATGYNIKHKEAKKVALGFNKVATDDYGHVIDYSAVTADDINAVINVAELSAATKALSAGTIQLSADTVAYVDEQIDEVYASAVSYTDAAIEALDSSISASSAGKYFTALAIENGKLVAKEEASIPVLEVESAGTGNVVEAITVDGHKISYTTTSVATSHDIEELSAATINLSGVVENFSAATDTKFSELSAYTEDVDNKVIALSSATVAEFTSAFTAIQGMDKDADAVAGQVVTTVAQTDGKVTETKANVKDLQLGGYVKDTAATGDIAGTDTINAALSKLENKANANKIANADGSINVTTAATGTDINVNIKSGEHVLAKDRDAGLYTNIKLSALTPSSDLVKEEYALYGTDNTILGDHIKIYKDQSLVSITLEENDGSGHTGQYLKYTYIDASGNTQSTYVNVSSFLVEAEFKSGVTADASGIVHGVVDSTSETFLTVGADGFKLSGVQDAIDAKVNALDVTGDTAVAGQYVAAIEQTDGLVAVKTRANVSEAVLNNYTKGTDATAVAATDTVNGAISKLENQIDKAKAAATTKVVEGTDAGNNMTITPTTGADGSVTYTVDLADVASATALTAEIAARKAVDGQNGDTYAANASTNFISDATSLNDADIKLDAAIKTLSGNAHDAMIARDNAVFSSAVTYVGEQIDEVYASGVSYTDAKVAAEIALLDSVGSASTTGHYLTSVTITNGKISAVGEVELPAAIPVTTVNGTTGDTAAAVIASVVTGGTEGHQLTLNYSNKVFSATTAESAVTSQSAITSLSAQTSVSANMAYEISSAATITSGQVTNFVEGVQNIKVNSAESADTAAKVANALSISGYATSESSALDTTINYDGSQAKSLTFGTNTAAGKSMSMTSAGVVDVEIIDCGEY